MPRPLSSVTASPKYRVPKHTNSTCFTLAAMQRVSADVTWSKKGRKEASKEGNKEGRKEGSREGNKEGRKETSKEERKESRKE